MQKIGPRELQLRAMTEARASGRRVNRPVQTLRQSVAEVQAKPPKAKKKKRRRAGKQKADR